MCTNMYIKFYKQCHKQNIKLKGKKTWEKKMKPSKIKLYLTMTSHQGDDK